MTLYITYTNYEFSRASGIWKKIVSQTEVFKKTFGKAYYTTYSFQTAYLVDGENVVERVVALTRREYLGVLIRWMEKYHVERTYIRYPFADEWFIELLKYQREHGIKTVLEIATYPYDGEFTYGRLKVEDAYYRRLVPEYVDVIASYSLHEEIWGKPCIHLVNGIEAASYRVNQNLPVRGRLTLIAVSNGMPFWNGYERLIEGLRIYMGQSRSRDVKIRFVGQGSLGNGYRTLAEKYGLSAQVEFCGALSGEALDNAYQDADVGIDSMGLYKSGIRAVCTMKGAEYCARGIPIVNGHQDIRFSEDTPFVLQIPNDESPVDIAAIVSFYEKLSRQEDYHKMIHQYALEHLSWARILQPVIAYFQED